MFLFNARVRSRIYSAAFLGVVLSLANLSPMVVQAHAQSCDDPGADPDADADNDGFADCEDECPADAGKSVEGYCGCFVADNDTDGDGLPYCGPTGRPGDECPGDAALTSQGRCGCGAVQRLDYDENGDRYSCEDVDGYYIPSSFAKVKTARSGTSAQLIVRPWQVAVEVFYRVDKKVNNKWRRVSAPRSVTIPAGSDAAPWATLTLSGLQKKNTYRVLFQYKNGELASQTRILTFVTKK
jgi:hypothetical protein